MFAFVCICVFVFGSGRSTGSMHQVIAITLLEALHLPVSCTSFEVLGNIDCGALSKVGSTCRIPGQNTRPHFTVQHILFHQGKILGQKIVKKAFYAFRKACKKIANKLMLIHPKTKGLLKPMQEDQVRERCKKRGGGN